MKGLIHPLSKQCLHSALLFTFVLSSNLLSAQQTEIDSLQTAFQQTDDDSLKYQIMHNLLLITDEQNRIEDLLNYVDQLEEFSQKSNYVDGLVHARFWKARIYFGRYYKMDTALLFLKQGLAIMDTSMVKKRDYSYQDYWNLTGLIYKNKFQYDSAIHYYQKIITNHNSGFRPLFLAYYNISNLYSTLGNDNRALEYAYLAYDHARKNNEDYIVNAFALLGEKYYHLRSYEKAIEMYDAAIAIWLPYAKNKYYEKSIDHANVKKSACLIQLHRFSEAEELLLNSIQHNAEIYGINHQKLAPIYLQLADLNERRGTLNEANEYLKKVLMVAENSEFERWYFTAFIQFGDLELVRANYEKALHYYRQAEDYSNSKAFKLNVWHKKANVFNELGEFKKAISAFKKSFFLRDSSRSFQLNNISNSWRNINKLRELGAAYEGLFEQDEEIENLELSLLYYQWGDDLIRRIRNIYSQQADEIDFTSLFADMYEGGVRVALELYALSNDEKYVEAAFQFSEKGKSSALLNSVLKAKPKFSSLPDSIVRRESDLRSNLQFYQSKLAKGVNDKNREKQYQESLISNTTEYETLLAVLQSEYPEYYEFKYDSQLLSISSIGAELEDDQTILEYSFYKNKLVAFIVNNQSFDMVELQTPSSLDSLIVGFNTALKDQNSTAYLDYGKELYDILYRPLEDLITTQEVVIVPDRILWYVNFEILPFSADGKYLLHDKAISYANSANQFIKQKSIDQHSTNQCLAFSYSASAQDDEGDVINFRTLRAAKEELPGASREVSNISDIMTGNYLYGSEANEKNFKELVGEYAILHLALHGEINDSIPYNSHLTFAKNESDTIEDNLLHAFELYDMKLNADMVVLSACNTGVGKLVGGEGVMNLGRAFQYAGTKSVLMSNWEVVDGAAPELMKYFYTFLNEGMSKSAALRLAKIEYLQSVGSLRSHPYYWGGFTLIGDSSSIQKEKFSLAYQIALLLLVLAILAAGILTIRKRSHKQAYSN